VIYASVEAVAEQWRPLDSRETAATTRLLDRVSALMRVYSPDLDDRVTNDADLSVVAAGVAVDAVIRVLRGLEGNSRRSQEDVTRPIDASLYLTKSEIESLIGQSDAGIGANAFTVRPGGLTAPVPPCVPRLGWW